MRSRVETLKRWRKSVKHDPSKPKQVGFRYRGASIFMNSINLQKVKPKSWTRLQNYSHIEPKRWKIHTKRHQIHIQEITTKSYQILTEQLPQIGSPQSDFFMVFGVPGPGWPAGTPGKPPRRQKVSKLSLRGTFPRINQTRFWVFCYKSKQFLRHCFYPCLLLSFLLIIYIYI